MQIRSVQPFELGQLQNVYVFENPWVAQSNAGYIAALITGRRVPRRDDGQRRPLPAHFEDQDGNGLILHHRYAPPGVKPPA